MANDGSDGFTLRRRTTASPGRTVRILRRSTRGLSSRWPRANGVVLCLLPSSWRTAASTSPHCACGFRRERAAWATCGNHWEPLSIVSALGVKGIRTAGYVSGAIDTEVLLTPVERFLRAMLTSAGAVVQSTLLPRKPPRAGPVGQAACVCVPRSPRYVLGLNPIEQASKTDSRLRKLDRCHRLDHHHNRQLCRFRDLLWIYCHERMTTFRSGYDRSVVHASFGVPLGFAR
jgi:hypothetical protein